MSAAAESSQTAILGIPLVDSPAVRRRVSLASAAAILLIAAADWRVQPNVSLGFLYVCPILVLGLYGKRLHIAVAAAACSLLHEALAPTPWQDGGGGRLVTAAVAFLGAGLFVSELARNRQLAVAHAAQLAQQIALREELQQELRVLVESSPAAILTLDGQGRVLLANEAAHRLLAFDAGRPLRGESMRPHLAALVSALERPHGLLRTNMECVGRRLDGEVFLAHVWFSTYRTQSGPRLAAIVLDVSDQLRDREAVSLGSVAAASRVLFGAVSHEVRNLASAAAVAHANLARVPGLSASADFAALGVLVEGLERIASSELQLGSKRAAQTVDLGTAFDELRIVLEPAFGEEEIAIEWRIARELPPVLADRDSLLQIFLNLAENSRRALAGCDEKRLVISAGCDAESVVVRFEDSGPGVSQPDELFKPFQRGGSGTGLGLFVSRTIARSFAGDLRYEPVEHGSRFAVHLVRTRLPEPPA